MNVALDPAADLPPTTLRSDQGDEVTLRFGNDFQAQAQHWAQKVRNRRRWVDQPDLRRRQEAAGAALLADLGVKDLVRLRQAKYLEVSIPYEREGLGWQFRIFPWEYVLSAALQSGQANPCATPIVIRRLVREGDAHPGVRHGKTLIVKSGPGPVRAHYKFDGEVKLVQSNLANDQAQVLADPTPAELKQRVSSEQPPFEIIHLAGVDTHQAVALRILPDQPIWDGYVVRDQTEGLGFLTAADLATTLTSGGKPFLVSCNFYNSASRLAPLLVAGGAGSTLGFQDEFSDVLGEQFLSTFYLALRLSGWNLLEAFGLACRSLDTDGRAITGSGIVLWSDRSLLEDAAQAEKRRAQSASPIALARSLAAMESLPVAPDDTVPAEDRPGAAAASGEPAAAGAPAPAGVVVMPAQLKDMVRQSRDESLVAEDLVFEYIPLTEINYAVLHNGGSLSKRFSVTPIKPGKITVLVSVELQVGGAETAKYEQQVPIEGVRDLGRDVCIPLTYVLRGALREGVNTTLRTLIRTADGKEIKSWTDRVKLLPFDEWSDGDSSRIWLPSFVLPRDPAIRTVIDAAQRYLMALDDDSNAGFDGYQRGGDVDGSIDLQVQAIWCALLYDFELHYINPPPSYGEQSQRLRMPSDLLAGKHGTCIDLALLLPPASSTSRSIPSSSCSRGTPFPATGAPTRRTTGFSRETSPSPPPRRLQV
jgi:hypothetical protein